MDRRWVYLAQVAHRFGPNAFLPYSAGRLWAYAVEQPEIRARYSLAELLWDREPVAQVIARMRSKPPAVLGLSTYIWNEQYNLALAQAVRTEFPSALIIAGGPQVPEGEQGQGYLLENPDVNMLLLGEGEEAFAAVLRQARWVVAPHSSPDEVCAIDLPLPKPATTRTQVGKTARVEDLTKLHSPYICGVFDKILARNPDVDWQALQETDRGCPYACTFCVWGSASLNQVRTFPIQLLKTELAWLARRKVEMLYNCDANFGMLPHHEEFTDCLMATSARTGYPKKFRAAYAKKITERVFRVANKLSESGLSKGATISFQSMNSEVLQHVKRINPVAKSLSDTFARYSASDIPTYSELILGLPGETLDSFYAGIDALLEAGQHKGLAVYPCMVLRNSQLADPAYRAEHGLRTRRVRQLLLHGTPRPGDVPEWYDLVIETATLPHDQWRAAWEFAAVVQALHCGGVTDELAHAARRRGLGYVDFYRHLISYAGLAPYRNGPLATELRYFERVLDVALAGEEWATVIPVFGPVQWPVEEALLLKLLLRRSSLYAEVLEWARPWITLSDMERQLQTAPHTADYSSLEEFAREVVWYGRKGRKLTAQYARDGGNHVEQQSTQ